MSGQPLLPPRQICLAQGVDSSLVKLMPGLVQYTPLHDSKWKEADAQKTGSERDRTGH